MEDESVSKLWDVPRATEASSPCLTGSHQLRDLTNPLIVVAQVGTCTCRADRLGGFPEGPLLIRRHKTCKNHMRGRQNGTRMSADYQNACFSLRKGRPSTPIRGCSTKNMGLQKQGESKNHGLSGLLAFPPFQMQLNHKVARRFPMPLPFSEIDPIKNQHTSLS